MRIYNIASDFRKTFIRTCNAVLVEAAVIVLKSARGGPLRAARPVFSPLRQICEAKSMVRRLPAKRGVQGANSPVQVGAQTCTRLLTFREFVGSCAAKNRYAVSLLQLGAIRMREFRPNAMISRSPASYFSAPIASQVKAWSWGRAPGKSRSPSGFGDRGHARRLGLGRSWRR